MDWDKLRIFHAAAQAGSFTHAGEQLGMSQSAVSRQVSALEQDLGVPLFHRHARGLILSEQGELLFRASQDVMMKLEGVKIRLTDSREKPTGTLRITTTVALGSTWLTERLNEFVDLHPQVNLHLILDDQELDLTMRQADVAIRLRQPVQPDLIQRRLFTTHYHVYASPDYVSRFGKPVPPNIRDVNWLEIAGRSTDNPREPIVRINNIYAIKAAVERGTGIAILPDYMIEEGSPLVKLMPEAQVPSFPTYFCYPAELKNSARVTAFRDFMLAKAQNWQF